MKAESDITRYLCATAYTDYDFRDKIIEKILKEDHTAIGVSYGVDMPAVVRHCLAAKRRIFVRDALVISSSLSYPIILLVFALLFGNMFDPSEQDLSLLLVVIGSLWFSFMCFSFVCVLWETWTRHSLLTKHFRKDNYDPDYVKTKVSAETARALDRISKQQKANVVVYSGFSPFIGSGVDLGGWSFSLNVHKGKEDLGRNREPQSFEVGELYSCLFDGLQKLSFHGLITEDKLFVNGKDIRDDRRFLPDPLLSPESTVSPELISEFIDMPTHTVRHYMCVRISDWKGEMVLSVFLRLAKNGGSFFAEANYLLLTPLAENYRKADSMRPSPGFGDAIWMIGVSLLKSVLIWHFSVVILFFKVSRVFFRWSENINRERLVAEDPTFDYGASGSVRHYVSSSEYRRYFQKLDKEMYVKTIERLILDRIIQFLDEKNIDTSELKDRQATILNNGVIVTGGDVRAKSLAVGQSAKASSSG